MKERIGQLEAEYGITGKEGFKEALTDWIESCIPTKREHKCLSHSTRDEDGELGWCDTCQRSFDGSTLSVFGWNNAIREMQKNLGVQDDQVK
jgi:hypothetical protein